MKVPITLLQCSSSMIDTPKTIVAARDILLGFCLHFVAVNTFSTRKANLQEKQCSNANKVLLGT